MKRIQLWSVSKDGAAVSAVPVDEVANTETEQLLEDMLVASPELLEPGLKLIGRQVPTDGGPLDLLGVDQDGRFPVPRLRMWSQVWGNFGGSVRCPYTSLHRAAGDSSPETTSRK